MAPVIHLWAFVLGHARIIMEYLLLYLCFLSLIFHSDLNNLVQIKSVFACTVMEFHPSAFSEWFSFFFLMDDITPNVSFNFEDIYFKVKFLINLFPHPHYLVVNR